MTNLPGIPEDPAPLSEPKAPTVMWLEEWDAHLEDRNLPQRVNARTAGMLGRELRNVWCRWVREGSGPEKASGGILILIRLWFSDRWGREVGFQPARFVDQINRLVIQAQEQVARSGALESGPAGEVGPDPSAEWKRLRRAQEDGK